jgi:hypothetical protein
MARRSRALSRIERQIGAEAMSLYVLDAFIWILGIRGHIPQSGAFNPVPDRPSFGASTGKLMRALAVFAAMVALLSLLLWLGVSLAIKLL